MVYVKPVADNIDYVRVEDSTNNPNPNTDRHNEKKC